ncbi:uncharacterized protein EDB93DRAFT_84181 [Suillus bovinus]|uniref:uncharacterized protein n=1 Tax=Suillus bovinus TaxID=48563 RepID=UPI001B86D779|nr:uncharacterized protein EDB93DRAFT_84181 [Suillus bovinus]KAG2130295.1 hypothetical protein EDB93DRAFT_84181 [Suillus bovinus]
MKLLMMFVLLHTIIIILAAPAGSNTARRLSIAGSSVTMNLLSRTQGNYPDSSSIGSSRDFMTFASDTLESGSTASAPAEAAGSVTSIMPAPPTVTKPPLLTVPSTANNDSGISNTCTLRRFNIDETSLKVCMVGVILAASFAGIGLIIVSLLTCSVGRCIKQYRTQCLRVGNCDYLHSCCMQTLCGHRVKA